MPSYIDDAARAADDLIKRLWGGGGSTSPSGQTKFQAMLRARRSFTGRPESESMIPRAEGTEGTYYPSIRAAVWKDGDRAIRRHEVMHGIFDAASRTPELRGAVPLWARHFQPGGFEDELLARLASKRQGSIANWPISAYAETDPLKYSVAGAIQRTAHAANETVRDFAGAANEAVRDFAGKAHVIIPAVAGGVVLDRELRRPYTAGYDDLAGPSPYDELPALTSEDMADYRNTLQRISEIEAMRQP